MNFIYRTDYPELGTFLVFDYGEKFTYLRKDKAKEWQREDEDLFEVALNNIANESIEIREHTFGGKFIVYVLLSGDFSASYTLLIRQLIDFSIGRFGSIIAIPTKGTAFIHPIESNDIMELIPILYPEL